MNNGSPEDAFLQVKKMVRYDRVVVSVFGIGDEEVSVLVSGR